MFLINNVKFKEEKMLKLKKIISGVIAAALSAGIMTFSTLAYTGTGTVKVSTYLNVRSSASTSSVIVGKLYSGTKVTITGSSNGWYKISCNGISGWASGSYITLTGSTSSGIQTVIDTAKKMIGVKYAYAGASPATGFDCSGLAMYCYAKAGVTLPHYTKSQVSMGISVSRSNLQAGDLIFFSTTGSGTINHVGIYIGNNSFINAQSGAGLVKQASLTTSYWSNAYVTARRYIY
jgi:cell wall-associated NlpC family hydrolase